MSADTTAPEVKSLTAVNANKFFIQFSEAVNLDSTIADSIKIKKGNTEFTVNSHANTGLAASSAADTTAEAYISGSVGYYTGYGYGFFVVIPEDNTVGAPTYTNPLYKDTETSVTLDVTVQNYKDKVALLGSKYDGQVKLSKNATTPVAKAGLVKTVTANTTVDVLFDNAIVSNAGNPTIDPADLVVKNSEGVILPSTEYTAAIGSTFDGDTYTNKVATVTIDDSSKYYGDTAYTVTFKKNAVKYKADIDSVSGYNAETANNLETTVTAGTPSDANAKYVKFNGSISTPTNKDNVFLLNYGTKMGESALDAANYKLDGKALPEGTKLSFYEDTKQVQFTLPASSVTSTTSFKLGISKNVKTAANQAVVKDLQSLEDASIDFGLVDNVKPKLVSAEYLVDSNDATETDRILVKFSEKLPKIQASDFQVVVNGNPVSLATASNDTDGDEYVILKLTKAVAVSQAATVSVKDDIATKENSVTEDAAQNKLAASSVTTTGKSMDSKSNSSTAVATGISSLVDNNATLGTNVVAAKKQQDKLTVAGTVTTAGDVKITLNSTDKTVAVAANDTAAQVATKVAAAYSTDTDYDVTASGADVVFTAKTAGVKTTTVSGAVNSTELTSFTAANVVTGAPEVAAVKHVATVTLSSTATANGNLKVTANGVTKYVTVVKDDTAAVVAAKVATAFADSTEFDVTSAEGVVSFTAKTAGAKTVSITVQ